MRRVEGVADDAAPGMTAGSLQIADQQTRGARGDDDVRGEHRIELAEQLDFGVLALGTAFLDEIGARHGRERVADEGETVGRGAGGEAEPAQHGPGFGDVTTHEGLALRRRIARRHIEPARQEIGRPAGADRAGADHRDPPHACDCLRHPALPNGVEIDRGTPLPRITAIP